MLQPWWTPDYHANRRPILLARGRIQAALRAWLAAQDFTEVDINALAISPGNEAHLHGFATQMMRPDGADQAIYLHTSPEFAMKKLLAAGEARIAAFAHVYRNRERGALHAPEFTMLEWYRAGADYTALMDDISAIIGAAVQAVSMGALQMGLLQYRGKTCDALAPMQRISVQDAFWDYAGLDLLASIDARGVANRDLLADAAQKIGLRVALDDTWSDIFSRILSDRVEPYLGIGQITILDRYPIAEAALARKCPDDPRLAERFEVYACGVELANGFGELTDAREQRQRFAAEMAEKSRIYGETYPLDDDFLAALAQMPPAAGIAMGFDRLVMLATATPHIDDVQWAPVAR
jgi:lysyl-tRNA synthetase class 2